MNFLQIAGLDDTTSTTTNSNKGNSLMPEAPVWSQRASEIHQNSDLYFNTALKHFHFHHLSALVWNINDKDAAVDPFLQDLTLTPAARTQS